MLGQIIAALTAIAPIGTVTAEPAVSLSKKFVCEAPGGDYAIFSVVHTDRVLRARISLVETAKDPTWAPAAGIFFALPGEQKYAGAQIYIFFNQPRQIIIGIKKPGKQPNKFATVPIGQPVDIDVYLSEDGELVVSAAGKTKSAKVRNAKIVDYKLMCSSGKFLFENVPPSENDGAVKR